jgi:hypothetical protein
MDMVYEEDPVCVDTDNIDIPSASSVKETVPEVRLFFDFFTSAAAVTLVVVVAAAAAVIIVVVIVSVMCVCFAPPHLTGMYSVTFSLQSAHDSFGGAIKIFQPLKQF